MTFNLKHGSTPDRELLSTTHELKVDSYFLQSAHPIMSRKKTPQIKGRYSKISLSS